VALDGATVIASPATQVHDLAHGLNALTIRMLDRREINRRIGTQS
jgi:hypothetical protein